MAPGEKEKPLTREDLAALQRKLAKMGVIALEDFYLLRAAGSLHPGAGSGLEAGEEVEVKINASIAKDHAQ